MSQSFKLTINDKGQKIVQHIGSQTPQAKEVLSDTDKLMKI
ncbi:MAG TPA: hypothetical protein VFY64_07205 [Nitrososphaeraceae archaeon]|nr:hypothetical protein [Nitrososphaeraceae archaeon]